MDEGYRCKGKPRGPMLGLLLALALLALTPVFGQGAPALEHRVKAAYLYNFLKFVDWPEPAAQGGQFPPIRVCLLGKDTLHGALDRIDRQKAKNRGIELHKLSVGDDPASCHLLFLSDSSMEDMETLLRKSHANNILLVSDINDFARRGGTIGFVKKRGKVHVEINHGMAKRAGLKLSANLLEIASTVYDR